MWSPHFWGIAHTDVEEGLQNWKWGLPQNSMRTSGKISLHTEEEAASGKVWGFFPFASKTGTDSELCWQKYDTQRCEEFFLILLINITTLPKPQVQEKPYTGRAQQNLDSCPLYSPVTSNESKSTGYNVNRWLTHLTPSPLFKTTTRKGLGEWS